MLDRVLTQAEFADLVGITQQAASDLARRGVLKSNMTGGAWVHAYCERLREGAAQQSGTLATARAALDNERRDEVAMRNALKRSQYAPVAVLDEVLARVGRKVARILGTLPADIRLCWPDATPDQLHLVDTETARACALAASMGPGSRTEDTAAPDC